MTQRVLGEGPPARVRPDGARLVRMRQVVIELTPQLAEISEGHDLLAGLEESAEVILQIHHLDRKSVV